MSDVTDEEVNAERGRANAFFVGLGFLSPGPAAVTAFATALALRAKEARRDGIKSAYNAAEGWGDIDDALKAIRVLMEPGT